MTDRELLALAAKAAGIQYTISENGAFLIAPYTNPLAKVSWNPLQSDGDALRLAVKLNEFEPYKSRGGFRLSPGLTVEEQCRAITRAAAELGKGMK